MTEKGRKDMENNFDINSYIYAKQFECPVCEEHFASNVVRESKMRMRSVEFDLHPICSPINPNFYDVIICPKCGYAAVKEYFANITSRQAATILAEITPKYKAQDYPAQLDEDLAIKRYEQVLRCALAKNAKDGEKAYICMKLMWFYRLKGDVDNQKRFAELTLKGFSNALANERLPIMGLADDTITYLLGALHMVLGDTRSAMWHLSEVVVSKTASDRLKDKARNLKDEMNA
jgi:uncharacterized protein (DUF2225 family)